MAEEPAAHRSAVRPDVLAAREAVVAARASLLGETERLEASARAAVDVPARVRRNPGKAASLAAGAGFLLLGGPGRVVKGLRRAIGRPEPLPKSMLPDEVEKTLRKMGDDGDKVRGTLEREFAKYLDENAEKRKERDLSAVAALILTSLAKPAARAAGLRMAKDLAAPDGPGFADQLARIRARASAAVGEMTGGSPSMPPGGPPPGMSPGRGPGITTPAPTPDSHRGKDTGVR